MAPVFPRSLREFSQYLEHRIEYGKLGCLSRKVFEDLRIVVAQNEYDPFRTMADEDTIHTLEKVVTHTRPGDYWTMYEIYECKFYLGYCICYKQSKMAMNETYHVSKAFELMSDTYETLRDLFSSLPASQSLIARDGLMLAAEACGACALLSADYEGKCIAIFDLISKSFVPNVNRDAVLRIEEGKHLHSFGDRDHVAVYESFEEASNITSAFFDALHRIPNTEGIIEAWVESTLWMLTHVVMIQDKTVVMRQLIEMLEMKDKFPPSLADSRAAGLKRAQEFRAKMKTT